MLFAQKNEKPGKAKRVTFRSAEDQKEPNQPDLVLQQNQANILHSLMVNI